MIDYQPKHLHKFANKQYLESYAYNDVDTSDWSEIWVVLHDERIHTNVIKLKDGNIDTSFTDKSRPYKNKHKYTLHPNKEEALEYKHNSRKIAFNKLDRWLRSECLLGVN